MKGFFCVIKNPSGQVIAPQVRSTKHTLFGWIGRGVQHVIFVVTELHEGMLQL
jgi:hypothetical protein